MARPILAAKKSACFRFIISDPSGGESGGPRSVPSTLEEEEARANSPRGFRERGGPGLVPPWGWATRSSRRCRKGHPEAAELAVPAGFAGSGPDLHTQRR